MKEPNDLSIALASEADTKAFALALAPTLTSGIEIALVGGLGAGKTTFTRYLLQALGVSHDVTSPTYVLEFRYRAAHEVEIEHWDLFRIRGLPLELEEPPSGIRIVEWADRVPEYLMRVALVLTFDRSDDTRSLALSGPRAKELLLHEPFSRQWRRLRGVS